MKPKTLVLGSGVAVVCAACFWLGTRWASLNVSTYQVDRIRVSFHADYPIYGLPMVDYSTILNSLRTGDTNTAIQKAEAYLDLAVYDAKQRRPLLTGWQLSELDKSLQVAAQYRQQYPRARVAHDVGPRVPGTAAWLAEAEIKYAERYREIDSFLGGFR